jgi:hypothetical protein
MKILRRARENDLRDKVCKDALHIFGIRSLQLDLRHDAGWPDRLVLISGGRPAFMEFKRPGEVPRPLQIHRLETLIKLGYDACWVDNYADAMLYITKRLK